LGKKAVTREWERRWEGYLNTNDLVWSKIWNIVHTNLNTPYVKSALWEMNHLNYWSNYRANETCKLCGNWETDITHILNACPVLLQALADFNIGHIYNSKVKISFGVEEDILDNYILCQIKSIIFRSRFMDFNSMEACRVALYKRCKATIARDLKLKYKIAKANQKTNSFTQLFGRIATVEDNGEIDLHFN
jgi:hypothetical protein